MLKKIVLVLVSFAVVLILGGLFAANFMFDKYLAQPEVIEELVTDMKEDAKNIQIEKVDVKLLETSPEKMQSSKTQHSNENSPSSKNIMDNTRNLNAVQKNIDYKKNQMENIDNLQKMDNNVKRSARKIKVDPADKTRVIAILKSSLTSSDIQELKKIVASRPLTSEKIARAKAILKARLSKQQKNELKAIYRKYYG